MNTTKKTFTSKRKVDFKRTTPEMQQQKTDWKRYRETFTALYNKSISQEREREREGGREKQTDRYA